MMGLRITIGIVVCVALSAWAFYIDNRGIRNDDIDSENGSDK